MSFSLSVDGGKLEWGSHDLSSIFAQKSNMFSPSFLLMIREVLRFGKEAPKVLTASFRHTAGFPRLHPCRPCDESTPCAHQRVHPRS